MAVETEDAKRDVIASGPTDPFRLIGVMLDDAFRVDAFIAAGGFGKIYRGWQPSIERQVAIKCSEVASADPALAALDRTSAEAQLIGKLQQRHAAIVQVIAQGVTTAPSGQPIRYIVMEWLDGEPLSVLLESSAQLLAAGRFSEKHTTELLRPAIEAIAAAHRMEPPVVHRDLKPSNLFVLSTAHDVRIKVLDFGSARTAPTGAGQLALTTLGSYTPAYAAPEQAARGLGAIGPWTDVFALGLILEEMVLGPEAPSHVTDDESESRCALRADLSEAFKTVCRRALMRRCERRYRDAGELLDALDGVLQPKPAARRWPYLISAAVLALAVTGAAAWSSRAREDAKVDQVQWAPAVVAPSEMLGNAIQISARDAGQKPAPIEQAKTADVVEPAPELKSMPAEPPASKAKVPRRAAIKSASAEPAPVPATEELKVRAQRVSDARKTLAACANVEPDWFRELCKNRESAALKSRQEEYELVAPSR